MKKLLFLLCLIFFLFAGTVCKKDNDLSTTTTVEGVVIDKTTQKPIANAMVYLIQIKSRFMSGSSLTVISQTTADAYGKYSFTFTHDLEYSYTLGASADNYFTENGGTNNSPNVNTGKKNKLNVLLQPIAFLKLHIKNTQLLGADAFSLQEYFDIYRNSIYPFRGFQVDTTIILNKSDNLIAIKQYDIYCPAFDTTLYTINY